MKSLLDIAFIRQKFAELAERQTRLALKWHALPGNVRGGLYMLVAAFLFSVMIALIKIAGQRLHVTEILFFRQLTMIAIAAPIIAPSFPRSLYTARPGLQALRIILAFFAMVLGFSAFIHLPLAEVTTVTFAKTFFITVLAILLLGEVVGARRWGAMIAGFLGVLVIAWPSGTDALNIYGFMAVISSACVAAVIIIIRKLSQVDQPITIMTYQAMGVGLLMVLPAIYFWKTPTLGEIMLLIAIGGFSALGQYCNIMSLRAAEASFVSLFDYSRLVYSLLLGLWLFNEWPETRVFFGAVLIIAAAIYTLHRERAQAKST